LKLTDIASSVERRNVEAGVEAGSRNGSVERRNVEAGSSVERRNVEAVSRNGSREKRIYCWATKTKPRTKRKKGMLSFKLCMVF